MTDYLEQILEESADALLEQQRRMERSIVSGGWSRENLQTARQEAVEQTAALQEEVPESERRKKPASELMDTLRQSGGWLTQPQKEIPSESGAEAQKLLLPLEEAVFLPDFAQSDDWMLPLERQTVHAQQTLDAARKLPTQWSGSALRRKGSFPSSAAAGMAREQNWSSDLAGEAQQQRLGAVLAGADGMDRDWAQQVDRAFRRDSRRYDNGFFLY